MEGIYALTHHLSMRVLSRGVMYLQKFDIVTGVLHAVSHWRSTAMIHLLHCLVISVDLILIMILDTGRLS